MNTIVDDLRRLASGDAPVTINPKDWRPGEPAMILWQAADEIERLRSIAGAAAIGPSFAEIAKDLPRRSGESD